MAPSEKPTTPEMSTTEQATRSEMRAPEIRRLKMSRPRLSVPSTCGPANHCGATSDSLSDCRFGSNGVTSGPIRPTTIRPSRIRPPAISLKRHHWRSAARLRARARSATADGASAGGALVADARVDDCIHCVDAEVNQHEDDRVQQYEAGDERVVARADPGDEQIAHTRPGEDGLD